MENWAIRTERKRKERGWSKAELARRADVEPSLLRHYLSTGVSHPRDPDTIPRIARALDVDPMWLERGYGEESSEIPIVGYAANSEGWVAYDGAAPDPDETISFVLGFADPVAIEVRGSSNLPVYRDKDRLICARFRGGEIDRAVGRDCVVRTAAGEHLLKFVTRGRERGTFNLRSYNPQYADLENVRLDWAATVEWIRRG